MASATLPSTEQSTPEPAATPNGPESVPPSEAFGSYQLLDRIGRGGMADVFRAAGRGAEGFRRMFVIKRMHADKCSSPALVEMFCDEARLSALLHHPNIVQVHEFSQHEGRYYLAMEYLHGRDLGSVMRVVRAAKTAVPATVAAHIAEEVAEGLHYAHTLRAPGGQPLQIVHRDINPANVMLLWTGGVKILDFGIAKASRLARRTQTPAGTLKGKVAYLSPEQVKGAALDARSDVFSLGVTLWEMLTGARLFGGGAQTETLRNILTKQIPPPSSVQPGVPAALDRIVLRALERDRERRYPSADALASDLGAFLATQVTESHAVRRFLHDLFGDQSTSSIEIPEPIQVPPGSVPHSVPVVIEVTVERRPRRKRTAAVLATVGALAAAVAAVVVFRGSDRMPQTLVPAAVAVPATVPAPETVSLNLLTSPAGARILDTDGAVLGVTPARVAVPRSAEQRTLRLEKQGFQPALYRFTADHDGDVLLELQPNDPPQRSSTAAAGRPRSRPRGRAAREADPFERMMLK